MLAQRLTLTVIIVLGFPTEVDPFSRHAMFLLHPRAEVNQLTAFGAEWPMRVVFPCCLGPAGGTFDAPYHRTRLNR
jgi:hypothetical protein